MTEITWLIFIIWLAFFVLGLRIKEVMLPGVGALIAFVFSFNIFSDSELLGLIFFGVGAYQLYTAIFGDYSKK